MILLCILLDMSFRFTWQYSVLLDIYRKYLKYQRFTIDFAMDFTWQVIAFAWHHNLFYLTSATNA